MINENEPVYLCDECGETRVDQDGGTCMPCWQKIDESKAAPRVVSLKGTATLVKRAA
jgi:predicted ATP-dependent serine protease